MRLDRKTYYTKFNLKVFICKQHDERGGGGGMM